MSDTCAGRSRAHHEPRAGTASPALGWLLVEQPGAWGRDALTASGLDPAIGAGLAAAAADVPVRVQTIRRPGGGGPSASSTRTVVLAHAGPTPWVEVLDLADDRALLDLDPAVCAEPDPPGLGARHEAPLFLVCTHAKRDRCCATWGRPIADTLAALHPDSAWEVSHIGGHRFAGNLVVLPEGLVYGGLDVATAVRVVDLHGAGRIDLDLLRGQAALPRAAQAADILVRRDLGVDRIGAVEDVTVVDGADGAAGAAGADRMVTVELTVPERGRWRAQVAKRPLGASYASSCDSGDLEDPGRYELVDLTQLAPH